MIKKYGDMIASAVLLVFAGVYYSATFELNLKNKAGNALVPRITAYILAACALFILGQAVIKHLKERKDRSPSVPDIPLEENPVEACLEDGAAVAAVKSDYRKVVLTLLFIIVYAVIFPLLGFLVSTPVYLCGQIFLLMPAEKRKKFWVPIILSVVFTVVIYLIFTRAFLLVLPTGTIW